MMKPNKSILKRVKITGTGKLIRRRSGQNHFNSKESRRSQRQKRSSASFTRAFAKNVLSRI